MISSPTSAPEVLLHAPAHRATHSRRFARISGAHRRPPVIALGIMPRLLSRPNALAPMYRLRSRAERAGCPHGPRCYETPPSTRDRLNRQRRRAVTEMLFRASQLAQDRQQQVRHRRELLLPKVAVALKRAAGAPGQHDRQRIMVVRVAVAHAAAVEDQRVIQQRAVAVRQLCELVEEVREQARVIAVQHREARLVVLVVGMMREDVEGIADAALRIHGIAQFLRQHEGADAGDLRLPGQRQQVVHQLDVLFHVFRNAGWACPAA